MAREKATRSPQHTGTSRVISGRRATWPTKRSEMTASPVSKTPAHLGKIAAERKRGAEWHQRIDELLARSIAQDENVAPQVAYRVLGLAVERGKITRCQMRGCGEH